MEWAEVCVIYDDRAPPPTAIEAIIGASRFSNVIKRRRRLQEITYEEIAKGRPTHYHHITSRRDITDLIEDMPAAPMARIYLLLPSCLMATRDGGLSDAVAKTRFAPGSTFLSQIGDDVAPVLLTRDDAIAVLTARDAEARRVVLARLRATAPTMRDYFDFVDLRKPTEFLKFMSGATEARHFNRAEITDGVFRKSSTDVEKMRAEHAFFQVTPEAMRRFIVPTFDFQETDAGAAYSTEHMLVPDAALQLIHNAFEPESFQGLLDQYFRYLSSRPKSARSVTETRTWAQTEIWGKVERRMAVLAQTQVGQRLDAMLTACGPMGGLSQMLERARPLVQKAIAADRTAHLVFAHGDTCFSNILFDRRSSLFRLIDPKGALRLEDGLMHPIYDLAKLSHSVLSGYDFVNNDLFSVAVEGDLRLELELLHAEPLEWMRPIFLDRCEAEGIDMRLLRATELTLFLSMLPLHQDSPKKLAAFALIACNIIETLE